ncbi:MAG: FAD-dependent oxidoreductase [Bacteroidetes bacterium]|nr:FAD-dependent oxidoreductase [Bacteroidota bacterium]
MQPQSKIVIIGSGMAGSGLALELAARQIPVTLITGETAGYYSRPLLSHAFSDQTTKDRMMLKSWKDMETAGVTVMTGTRVLSINREEKSVLWESNSSSGELPYDQLVLATGSDALIPGPWKAQKTHFSLLNSYNDLENLLPKVGEVQNSIAIVGGGLIGCEVASDLNKAGKKVTLFHGVDRLMERQLSESQSAELLAHFQFLGIDIRLNTMVKGFEPGKVLLPEGDSFSADLILVAVGFLPRTELAKQAGLETGRGIKASDFLKTSDDSIFAIGDTAEINGQIYAFVLPIRSQVKWLTDYLSGKTTEPWTPGVYPAKAKIHGLQLKW